MPLRWLPSHEQRTNLLPRSRQLALRLLLRLLQAGEALVEFDGVEAADQPRVLRHLLEVKK